jgi:hypothetical protein
VGKFVNFVRVHKGLLSSPFLGDSTMNHLGGERHRGSVSYVTGYSATAQRTGNPAYLEPNSGSLQKPIEGLSEKIEDRSRIGCSVNQKHAEKPEPPKPTRNQSPFKTLIPHDTTLISAILASNRKQQHRIRYPKRDATPHPHGCGVKGERAAQREAQMTPCIGKTTTHQQKGFHQTPNRHHQTARQRQRRLENGSA